MTLAEAFTAQAWAATEEVRGAIDAHPFVLGLADGGLPRDVFEEYLAQDAAYLAAYARVLAACATQARTADEVAFWGASAHRAVAVERTLHVAHLGGRPPAGPSPTCLAYTSYLAALSTQGSYEVLVAGLLPCFWIYEDVGTRLQVRVAAREAHPYADWVATYGDPAFAEATAQARGIADRAAEQAGPAVRERMLAAFTTASRYEWMFWDAAWRRERWPV